VRSAESDLATLPEQAETRPLGTPRGRQGIDAEAGRHLLVAESADDFAAATLRAMTDPGCAVIGRAARTLMTESYGWEPALRRFDDLLAGRGGE
jgi:hypothetical protein